MNLTKKDLVNRISEETDLTQQQVHHVVQKMLDYVVEALAAGKNVELRKFGVFVVQQRKARIGRNPHKPENEVTIPPRKVVKFKSGKIMKQQISAGPAATAF